MGERFKSKFRLLCFVLSDYLIIVLNIKISLILYKVGLEKVWAIFIGSTSRQSLAILTLTLQTRKFAKFGFIGRRRVKGNGGFLPRQERVG